MKYIKYCIILDMSTHGKIAVMIEQSWTSRTATRKSAHGVACTSLRRLGHPARALGWVPGITFIFFLFSSASITLAPGTALLRLIPHRTCFVVFRTFFKYWYLKVIKAIIIITDFQMWQFRTNAFQDKFKGFVRKESCLESCCSEQAVMVLIESAGSGEPGGLPNVACSAKSSLFEY